MDSLSRRVPAGCSSSPHSAQEAGARRMYSAPIPLLTHSLNTSAQQRPCPSWLPHSPQSSPTPLPLISGCVMEPTPPPSPLTWHRGPTAQSPPTLSGVRTTLHNSEIKMASRLLSLSSHLSFYRPIEVSAMIHLAVWDSGLDVCSRPRNFYPRVRVASFPQAKTAPLCKSASPRGLTFICLRVPAPDWGCRACRKAREPQEFFPLGQMEKPCISASLGGQGPRRENV